MLSLPQSVSLWIIKTTLKSPNNKPGTDLFTVYLPLLVPLVSGSLLTGKQWKSGLTPHVCTLSFNVQSPRHCQYGPSLASDLQRLLQIRGRLSHLQASAPHRRSFRMADAPPPPRDTAGLLTCKEISQPKEVAAAAALFMHSLRRQFSGILEVKTTTTVLEDLENLED